MTELFRDIQYAVLYAFEDGNNVLKNRNCSDIFAAETNKRLLVVWIHYTELCVTLQSIWKLFHQSSFFFFYNSWICNREKGSPLNDTSHNLFQTTCFRQLVFHCWPSTFKQAFVIYADFLNQANNWVSRRPLYGWSVPQSGPMLILNWIGEKLVLRSMFFKRIRKSHQRVHVAMPRYHHMGF